MARIPKVAAGVAALALVAGGAVLWTKFGSLVYFDVLATTSIGCLI
jgi:hypothetical protein